MLITGLAKVADIDADELNSLVDAIALPELSGCLSINAHHVNQISGWQSTIKLPHEHAHRSLKTIVDIIDQSRLTDGAKQLATHAFEILAQAEAKVHNIAVDKVAFHEVGALDSILDTCLAAALFDRLNVDVFYCSPLPLCDGIIRCDHGLITSPAPAVQEMLSGVPVYGINSRGETVTPTALAFLLAAKTTFGNWQALTVERVVRAYGGRVLSGVPNGAVFALGDTLSS
jgi:uncharacterized protein (DUF111 family)